MKCDALFTCPVSDKAITMLNFFLSEVMSTITSFIDLVDKSPTFCWGKAPLVSTLPPW